MSGRRDRSVERRADRSRPSRDTGARARSRSPSRVDPSSYNSRDRNADRFVLFSLPFSAALASIGLLTAVKVLLVMEAVCHPFLQLMPMIVVVTVIVILGAMVHLLGEAVLALPVVPVVVGSLVGMEISVAVVAAVGDGVDSVMIVVCSRFCLVFWGGVSLLDCVRPSLRA